MSDKKLRELEKRVDGLEKAFDRAISMSYLLLNRSIALSVTLDMALERVIPDQHDAIFAEIEAHMKSDGYKENAKRLRDIMLHQLENPGKIPGVSN